MTRLEALTFDLQNRSMFRMVNTHSDAVKAAELDMTLRAYRRALKRAERERRASLYQAASVVLFFGSGLCSAFGAWCFWCGAGVLPVLSALGAAAVVAAMGFWCDGWSRE